MRTLSLLLILWLAVDTAVFSQEPDTLPGNLAPVPVVTTKVLPPMPPSPVLTFRELLAMDEAQRELAFATMSAPRREFYRTKLRQYALLPPAQREERLRTAQLHGYLSPLMKLDPAARAAHLAAIPEADRLLVEDRLRVWDQLPADLRQDVLASETVMYFFVRVDSRTPSQQQASLQGLPEANRQRVEAAIARWQSMSPQRQQAIYSHFQQFIAAPTSEKEKTLRVLAPAEREQLTKALRALEDMPLAQRQRCLESFRKYVHLSPAEREQFLRNVERWRAMSPEQKAAWRRLVTQLPPLPPGAGGPKQPPQPPMPPRPGASAAASALASTPGGE
jgi:hypothetical protein